MAAGTHFSADDARRVGAEIGIDWDSAPFDIEQFRQGMEVELEHGHRALARKHLGTTGGGRKREGPGLGAPATVARPPRHCQAQQSARRPRALRHVHRAHSRRARGRLGPRRHPRRPARPDRRRRRHTRRVRDDRPRRHRSSGLRRHRPLPQPRPRARVVQPRHRRRLRACPSSRPQWAHT
jgi:hypothetical protein